MSRLLWHIDIFKVFKTHKTVNVCGKIQSQEMLPFLCLLTAARWRHKTLLSRRQHKFPVKEIYCKLSNLQRLLWSLCHIYFSTMKWNLPAKSFAIWFVYTCRCQRRMYSCAVHVNYYSMIADSIWTWVYHCITFVNDVILKIQLSMLLELYLTYP